jgi:hypothetical protein
VSENEGFAINKTGKRANIRYVNKKTKDIR